MTQTLATTIDLKTQVKQDRYAAYAKHLREAIELTDELGDADTADRYTEISRTIDKRLWFLEAHLVKKSDLTN